MRSAPSGLGRAAPSNVRAPHVARQAAAPRVASVIEASVEEVAGPLPVMRRAASPSAYTVSVTPSTIPTILRPTPTL